MPTNGMVNPTNCNTLSADSADIHTDAVILGAGPVGLFQVFQLGLHGIRAHLIDTLPYIGGQCAQLYADKPIYDIPALPCCTGSELVQRLEQQIAPFAPTLHLSQQVNRLKRMANGSLLLATTAGQQFHSKTLFIAAGIGAFVPRTIKAEGMDSLAPGQVLYHPSDLACAAGQHVVIQGADDAALQAALACQATAASVTLLHRRDNFNAAPALLAELQAQRASGQIHVAIGQITAISASATGRLQALILLDNHGQTRSLPATVLLAWPGISPRLGPITEWGLALEQKQLAVDTAHFQTSEAGIYAIGDINHYPGKRKLIVCGFHEATLAAFAAAEYITGQPAALQYTTSSSQLQQRLGIILGIV